MAQLNLNLSKEFQKDLETYMKARGITTKSDAIKVALREAVMLLKRKRQTDFKTWLGADAQITWASATGEERDSIDRLEVSRDLMKKYCKIAFPGDPSKHLTFHALRHCYAINLLTQGVSMSLVAQSLGNTLSVCQQYYVGFELTNESIEAINAIVSRRKDCQLR